MTNATVQMLLRKADTDWKVAHSLLQCDEQFQDSIAFHIQQSMEKNLKAFLVSQFVTVDRTHDLMVLLKRCDEVDAAFGAFIIPLVNKINDFAVQIRYEDIPDVNKDLLIAAIDEASRLQKLVISKIQSLK